MDIRAKLLITTVILALLTMLGVGLLTIHYSQDALEKKTFSELEAVASLQKARVEEAIARNLERLRSVTSRSTLRLSLNEYEKSKSPQSKAQIASILLDVKYSTTDYQEIYVLDPEGFVLVSSNPTVEGQLFFDSVIIEEARTNYQLSPISLDEYNNPYLYLYGPLVLDTNFIGMLVIRESASSITEITSDFTGLGETGETLLVKKGPGNTIAFIAPVRFPDVLNVPPNQFLPIPSESILLAVTRPESTYRNVSDYRDQTVLVVTKSVNQGEWSLLTKIDEAEAFEPIVGLRNLLIFVNSLVLAIILVIIIAVAESISSPIQRLTRIAADISKGKLDTKMDPQLLEQDNEVGALARAFDRTLVSLKLAMQKNRPTKKGSKENPSDSED